MSLKSICLVILLAFITQPVFGQQTIKAYKDNDKFFNTYTSDREIKIVSMNAYNLYDTQHDEGFFDFTYLPLNHPMKVEKCGTIKQENYKNLCLNLDWTNGRLDQKINQLVKVIKGHGSLPDILALQEVENDNVIRQLAKKAGYSKYIVTAFKNRRGVDLALLYRTKSLKLIGSDEVENPGRASLRVHFKALPSNRDLFVYVNHWVAQSAPTFLRVESAKNLREDVDRLMSQYDNPSIVVVGDFNTKFSESEEVFGATLLDEKWNNKMVEAHVEALEKYPEYAELFPEGSYWQGRNYWQRFDRIFLSNNLLQSKNKLVADIQSYRLIYSTSITGEYTYKVDPEDEKSDQVIIRYPLKFNFLENPKYPMGFTDHLPTVITLKN